MNEPTSTTGPAGTRPRPSTPPAPRGAGPPPLTGPLVEVVDLAVRFGPVTAVRGVDLSVAPGECLALVGESGSGKSTVARALLGLAGPGARVSARRLRVAGRDATGFTERDWRTVRGRRIGLVSQDALVSLDPLRRVRAEIAEPMLLHRTTPRELIGERTVDLLRAVGVPEPEARAAQYPHQLSGGLRQRALIASALAAEPALLIADEPTTALDVTVQAQVLDLLAERTRAHGDGLLLISHDLAVVARLADRTAVLRHGQVVECQRTEALIRAPGHPYTRSLLEAIPARAPRRRRSPRRSPEPERPVVLDVRNVRGRYGRRVAVDGVSLRLRAGECLGLVGESGSGKSTLARIVLGLLIPERGEVELDGRPWVPGPERGRRPRRHRIQLVQQDPYGSLDPRHTVARVIGQAVPRGPDRGRRVRALLDLVGLGEQHLPRRPHQLSGGQRQRVALARALAPGPAVLVCDEPVSALDVTLQAQVLELLEDLRQRLGLALLFISHDLSVVRRISDRVAVMGGGRIVEEGPVETVFASPRHALTTALLAASPGRWTEQTLGEDQRGVAL